jgi:hypothetical protein
MVGVDALGRPLEVNVTDDVVHLRSFTCPVYVEFRHSRSVAEELAATAEVPLTHFSRPFTFLQTRFPLTCPFFLHALPTLAAG